MKQEQPPKELHEEIESFEDTRELSPNATAEQKIEAIIESKAELGVPLSKEDEIKIREIKKSFIEDTSKLDIEINKSLTERPAEIDEWKDERAPEEKKPWYLRVAAMFGIAGVIAGGAKEVRGASPEDTLSKKIPVQEWNVQPTKDSAKSNLAVYSSSKTKEGGITPTGFSNSFFENEYNLKEADIERIAQKYGFRTTTKEFQSDLVDYLLSQHPEIIKNTLAKYDQTNKGKDIEKEASLEKQAEGLRDGLLGVRTAFMLHELETVPPAQETPPEKPEAPQPKGKYVLNIRGDEPGSKGVYYFFENEKDFMNATDKIGNYSSREVFGNGSGQATINMNNDVFATYHTNGAEKLLGQAWLRDENDQKKFIAQSNTAQYYEGLTSK